MRNELLFIHILSTSVLIGGLILRSVFVPLSHQLKSDSEARIAIFLQARAANYVNIVALILLSVTAHLLLEPFKTVGIPGWIWLSLALTLLALILFFILSKQEIRISKSSSSGDWSDFMKVWSVEMSVAIFSVLTVLYLMIAKPF